MAVKDYNGQKLIGRLWNYIPGTVNWPGIPGCLMPGDRIRFKNISWYKFRSGFSDLTADSGGYWPHFVERPVDNKDAAVSGSQPGQDAQRSAGLYGNDAGETAIRRDFGLYNIQNGGGFGIEGGDGPGGEDGALIITWVWERPWGQRMIQVNSIGQPEDYGILPGARGTDYSVMSFYNVVGPVARPDFATEVWTPASQQLTLDSGPGTTSVTVVSAFGLPISLGPFQRVTPSGGVAPTTPHLQFRIPK